MHYKYFFVVLILLAISRIQHASYTELALETISFISNTITIYLGAEQKLASVDTFAPIKEGIFEIFNTIESKLNQLNLQIDNIEFYLENYITAKKYLEQYEKIYQNIDRIEFLYNETQTWAKYLKMNKSWDLTRKTDQMLSLDSDYPQAVLFELRNKFFKTKKNEVSFLRKFHNLSLQIKCDEILVTPHYQLFSLYKQIVFTEVQGFAIMAFSYMWKHKNISFNYEVIDVKNERINSIIEYTHLFKSKIKNSRNFIRRCDAKYKGNENIIGKTYASFNNVFYTTVLDPESFMIYSTFIGKNITKSFYLFQLHEHCDDNNHNYNEVCSGLLMNCQSALSIDFCKRNKEDVTSTKNYYWIKITERGTANIKNFGNKEHRCQSTQRLSHVVRGGHPFNQKDSTLYPVFCDCVDKSIHTKNDTIRAFSLLWSETRNKMVATGARLVAKDRMIHIQLREGKLLPNGEIDKATERWVPLPTFNYSHNFPNVAIYENGTQHTLEENIDFVSINYQYARSICLQKLSIDDNYLLTGIRFNYEYFDRLKLEGKYVGFNYDNGKITTGPDYKEKSCTQLPELILANPDDPLKFETHPHDSKEDQFITIRASDLMKDASQTTIPFFDLLEVAPETSVPITGIELFHKGQSDGTSGGYISLKIYPINLNIFMNPPSNHNFFNTDNSTGQHLFLK